MQNPTNPAVIANTQAPQTNNNMTHHPAFLPKSPNQNSNQTHTTNISHSQHQNGEDGKDLPFFIGSHYHIKDTQDEMEDGEDILFFIGTLNYVEDNNIDFIDPEQYGKQDQGSEANTENRVMNYHHILMLGADDGSLTTTAWNQSDVEANLESDEAFLWDEEADQNIGTVLDDIDDTISHTHTIVQPEDNNPEPCVEIVLEIKNDYDMTPILKVDNSNPALWDQSLQQAEDYITLKEPFWSIVELCQESPNPDMQLLDSHHPLPHIITPQETHPIVAIYAATQEREMNSDSDQEQTDPREYVTLCSCNAQRRHSYLLDSGTSCHVTNK